MLESRTILVVDDEKEILDFVKAVLEHAGYRVLVAQNGITALALCAATEKIDVLLTDIVMPGLNGVVLAGRLSQARPDLPIVFMTGYATDFDVKQLLRSHAEMGVHKVMRKPIYYEELMELIESLLMPSENQVRRASSY